MSHLFYLRARENSFDTNLCGDLTDVWIINHSYVSISTFVTYVNMKALDSFYSSN